MAQQQCFSRLCSMSLSRKSLIYFLYFSNSVCPSSQWQHTYSMQTPVLMLGKQIGLSAYLKKNGGINWHEFACFDVWASFVLCVLFVSEFRVPVRVKDKMVIVPLLVLTSINNWSHIECWLYFSEEKIIASFFCCFLLSPLIRFPIAHWDVRNEQNNQRLIFKVLLWPEMHKVLCL